ncbi:UNKNOWN [Stylonychia lemnae]|uniref:Phosphoglycerate mutase family protein n=1 Tax=Stylonychia lemnae TaxID=5949 RepID=A0A078AH92_STYLE|nr:UNKNOWN [Stylonychia lemnae]|eukprot:CDW81206.1 UNKNOWN [Stylonychia lemnae]
MGMCISRTQSQLEQKSEYQKCVVALVRHGQRADYAIDESIVYDISHDPPLTREGMWQAKLTGEALKKQFLEGGFEKVIIESSPFLRCIMTAAQICKEFQIDQFDINYIFSEKLTPNIYTYNPIDDLCIKKKDKKDIIQMYLDGVDFNDSKLFHSEIQQWYPENTKKAVQRTKLFNDQFIKEYKNSTKKVMHIVTTHGAFVTGFGELYYANNRAFNFCSITAIEFQGDQTSLLLDCYSQHIRLSDGKTMYDSNGKFFNHFSDY